MESLTMIPEPDRSTVRLCGNEYDITLEQIGSSLQMRRVEMRIITGENYINRISPRRIPSNFVPLGTVWGNELFGCIREALAHNPRIFDQVTVYSVEASTSPSDPLLAVTFFAFRDRQPLHP